MYINIAKQIFLQKCFSAPTPGQRRSKRQRGMDPDEEDDTSDTIAYSDPDVAGPSGVVMSPKGPPVYVSSDDGTSGEGPSGVGPSVKGQAGSSR